ncbi:hypothetical protein [Nocardioides sp.]|uniref:hypothetical protein n=1 Tax=Nocardioides sp. TaxID=35761 RepID=UPI0026263112|nr:hypothetical protein [Nocardioides sp.]
MDAFVIMPIRKEGSEEHRHFQTIYFDYVRPELEKAGYDVTRADEVAKAGAISRDIVERLATADLVVADLTDLNPNVFYELGIRHALRAHGTLIIRDEDRTPDLPFDLASYRIHTYGTSSISAISPLRTAISNFLKETTSEPEEGRVSENPVHDWLPSLPSNVVTATLGSEEGQLRKELGRTKRELSKYSKKYGLIEDKNQPASPGKIISDLLGKAREGKLPVDLFRTAMNAVTAQDRVGFLEHVAQILDDDSTVLASKDYIRLMNGSDKLGVPEARIPIAQAAVQAYPHDTQVRRLVLGQLAHSHRKEDRERAREELFKILEISVSSDGSVTIGAPFDLLDDHVGVALDSLHTDNMNDLAASITLEMLRKYPKSDVAIRNYARAQERIGHLQIDLFRAAATAPGASDVSMIWLGNTLHNMRQHRDALESYLLACRTDASDATNWTRAIESTSNCVSEGINAWGERDASWPLEVLTLIVRAAIASGVTQSNMDTIQRALEKVGLTNLLNGNFDPFLPTGGLAEELAPLPDAELASGRRELANLLYEMVQTELTDPARVPPIQIPEVAL